eukprot:scaffold195918_cov26-Tisochrysis_lutea.AAC.3
MARRAGLSRRSGMRGRTSVRLSTFAIARASLSARSCEAKSHLECSSQPSARIDRSCGGMGAPGGGGGGGSAHNPASRKWYTFSRTPLIQLACTSTGRCAPIPSSGRKK